MGRSRVLLLAVVCLAVLMSVSAFAGGKGNPNPGVIPPQASAHGNTYGDWGALWWQWALSLPVSENPLFDMTGEEAANGQSGPVFFLCGVMGQFDDPLNVTVERDITIPPGKTLFFPILNAETDNIGIDPPLTVEELYAWAASWMDATTELHANVDGRPINCWPYRGISSGPFSYWLPPEDNVAQYWGFDVSGTIYPTVSDGYWLMLTPLTPGQHVVNFGGTVSDSEGNPQFRLDITYNITVRPGPKK